MKRTIAALALSAAMLLSLSACGETKTPSSSAADSSSQAESSLVLSDDQITLNGTAIAAGQDGAVTVGNDIIYYQAGMGEDYGEGTEADEHTAQEAQAHTVVTIRQPGTYRISGTLTAGQLAIDLGEGAKTDPEAVVTLILDGVDLTCTVAPAVIFYNVYECDTDWVSYEQGKNEDYQALSTVDTSQAGARVVLADGSVNNVTGSYVARIYQEGTTEKLHKYDGAFYSKMSLNVTGETEGTGVLNITAENEGLDSELHLTINGGTINIQAQNDGINTNEDGVSVTTVNGGTLQINAGLGDEGDGIDSNGFLVINGGNVYTMANEHSADGGIDADKEIYLNGGFVVALGVRNDTASPDSLQQYMELSFASPLPAGSLIELTDADGKALLSFTTEKSCQCLTFSSPDLTEGTAYTLSVDGVTQQYTGNTAGGFNGGRGGPAGQPPEDASDPQEGWEDRQPPQRPEDNGEPPQDGGERPDQRPGEADGQPPQPENQGTGTGSTQFTLSDQIHSFSGISDSTQEQ